MEDPVVAPILATGSKQRQGERGREDDERMMLKGGVRKMTEVV